MKRGLFIRVLVVAGMVACGGEAEESDDVILRPPDATRPRDAREPEPDSDPNPLACNPLTQTGCPSGGKCTWIEDQVNPPIGHVGCTPVPIAPKAIGAACIPPTPGPFGYDDCAKGAFCLGGICKQICAHDGGAPICDQTHSCVRYADVFEANGVTVAGVCDPSCDPLTQELKVGMARAACGSPTPQMPNSGCYGYSAFQCAPVGMQQLTLLDRDPPRTNASGNPYLNGCAPGFIPLLYESTGSTRKLCTGFCAALEIDQTQPANLQGDPDALAKMPTDPMPIAGHGVCSALYKGSSPSSSCRFLYPYLEDTQGALPLAFEASAYLDTLGICLDESAFTFDHDMNAQTPNIPYPSCASLPKRTSATPGDFDDAADWGCQKRASTNALVKKLRFPTTNSVELVRSRMR